MTYAISPLVRGALGEKAKQTSHTGSCSEAKCSSSLLRIFSVINLNNSYNKNFILKHTILYIHCVDILMWSPTKLDFLFYDFSVIYYDFLKIQTK
jgi:hypothetical protein